MINVVFLLLIFFALLIISLIISRYDLLSPSVLLCFSFITGISFYLLNAKRLARVDFNILTVGLLSLCASLFVITENVLKFILIKIYRYNDKNHYNAFSNITYIFRQNYLTKITILILLIICTIVQIHHEITYVGSGGSIMARMATYRNIALTPGVQDITNNLFVLIYARIIYALIPVYIFCFIYNRIVRKKKLARPLLTYLVLTLSIVCIYLLTMARGTIFSIVFQILTAIVMCYNFSARNYKRKNLNKGRTSWFKYALLIMLLGIPLFYWGGVLSGKNYDQITPLQSVGNYLSYGLIRLDHIVSHGFIESDHFGQWSFNGVYSFLNKLGGDYPDYNIFPYHLNYGNTITIIGRWYVDFGVVGAIIMSCIISGILTYVYFRFSYSPNISTVLFNSFIYIFIIPNIYMAVYDDWFRNILSINQIFQIFVIFIVTKIILKNSMVNYNSIDERNYSLNKYGVTY